MAPPGPWRPEPIAVAFYGITGLGLLIGGAFARSRGKGWGETAVYGVAGATVFGGGAVLAVLGRMGHT
jgi:hypothetical protein